nr:hypothetical protein [uncultured Oscillibacter sp.]
MGKIVFGRNNQVSFDSQAELDIAVDYILTSANVDFWVHENNQEQGAWAPEDRIHFKSGVGVPDCLKKNMTAGKAGLYGRINCGEFCDFLRKEAARRGIRR